MIKSFILLIALVFAVSQVRAEVNHSCFPENNVSIPTGQKSFSFLGAEGGLNELGFHQTIDKFENVWGPIVREKYGKKLVVTRDWQSDKVNAHATRDDDNNMIIVVRGGLARHQEMSSDGLLLMICHELGHHLGGAPKIFRGTSTLRTWSSAEGQADYFATSKCIGKIFDNDFQKSLLSFPDEVQSKIDHVCEQSSCARVIMAALSVGRVMASLKSGTNPPEIDLKDNSIVAKTIYTHPNPQCRFDTFVAGLNCEDENYIDFDDEDAQVGACPKEDKSSRPSCWFSNSNY